MAILALPVNGAQFKADIVLEGGGVRGIGHVGALSFAEEIGYQWVNIAGTSAGAFVAAMLAAGYSAQEMYTIMRNEVDFSRFAQDKGLDGLFPVEALHLLRRGGLHTGNYIETFIETKLKERHISTFGDLIIPGREHEAKSSNFRYRLTVIASDISTGRMLRLPQDIAQYGLDSDKLSVALAVRMSASIPFFFLPVTQKHKDGRNCLIVDGGLLSNFPVYLFDVKTEPRHPTFGLRLVDSLPTATCPWPFNPTNNILEISKALLKTMLTAHDRLYMDDHTYVRTIAIPVDGISSTEFNLSSTQADKLYQNGRKAAEHFFSTWDFEAYKATYRSDLPQMSRQKRLHDHMRRAPELGAKCH